MCLIPSRVYEAWTMIQAWKSTGGFLSGKGYPLVICYVAIEHGHLAIEIVDLPIKNGDFP